MASLKIKLKEKLDKLVKPALRKSPNFSSNRQISKDQSPPKQSNKTRSPAAPPPSTPLKRPLGPMRPQESNNEMEKEQEYDRNDNTENTFGQASSSFLKPYSPPDQPEQWMIHNDRMYHPNPEIESRDNRNQDFHVNVPPPPNVLPMTIFEMAEHKRIIQQQQQNTHDRFHSEFY